MPEAPHAVLSCILDVPLSLVLFVPGLLAEHRRETGTRAGTRALTCRKQAVFALAWFRDRPGIRRLGYEGAGAGVFVPVEKPARGELDINTKTRNALLRSLRYQGERGFALMSRRWRALQHVMLSPATTGDIAKSVLVLTQFEDKTISWKLMRKPHCTNM